MQCQTEPKGNLVLYHLKDLIELELKRSLFQERRIAIKVPTNKPIMS